MNDFGNCKNSVGLKPNAEWKKDAKAPSIPISNLSINWLNFNMDKRISATNSEPILYEGALASFFHSALGFSPTLFLRLPKSLILI
jgi:hypothetical protein